MSSYEIVGGPLAEYRSLPTPAHKFCAMVSFNGKEAAYHEVDSLDPATIKESLEATALVDEKVAAERVEVEQAKEAIADAIVDGQIVVPE